LKLTKLEKYIFAKFPVTGYKISLKNFDENIDKIYLHEETLKEVNFNEEIDIASLDPIIATVNPNFLVNEDSKELDINNFYLLDGHHRVEYAKSKKLIPLLNCVLVNYDDVIIKPYDFGTNLDLSEFISILNDNNFTESQEGSFNIKISNKIFVNKNIVSYKQLYEFKRLLQNKNIINPVLNNQYTGNLIVQFEALEKKELLSMDYLLPPKSTWIEPRI
jgi:uncharacterized protein (DUF1015 family)